MTRAAVVLAGTVLLASAAPALAQSAARSGRAPGVAALSHEERPWGTVVAVVLAFPTGSVDDPEDLEGTAWLTGEVVADAVRTRLGPGVASVDVRVDRGRTVFRMLAVPSLWRRAADALLDAVADAPLEEDDLDRSRAHLVQVFAFERGAPVREFDRELHRVLVGLRNPWNRDPRGSAGSVAEVELEDVERFRSRRYRLDRAAVAVVGPASRFSAEAAFGPPPAAGSGSPDDDAPWRRGDRLRLVREVTNAWIGVAYPAPGDASRTALEMLAHRAEDALNPDPPNPGVFSTDVEVVDTPSGPVLLVRAAVLPEAAEAWEERILDTVEELEDEEPDPSFFRVRRRRFRARVLTAEGDPGVEAERRALDLLRDGRARDLALQIQALTPGLLAETADELGPPRIVVMGPDLGDVEDVQGGGAPGAR